jgi:hypothetical protein
VLVIVIGFGLVFAGYSIGLYGYCLVRGYDVSFRNLFSTQWPGAQVIPSKGHKLGTIPGNVETTNPGQQTAA